ncbi:methyltransferase [Candidatus Woesearchaeota archaeon]|jgi:23S rRNA G2445 N2-methylase RlmL|nr:methyltransferase [Candidatus Woesearchaeota archaeon]MBT6519380.1 methyltransferase [Candidatus Woesearchaeota archaeon]MBT7367491.1 methyltransferase [Candidatus Woesearchaeota archaeon]
MKAFALTHPGNEQIANLEVTELLNVSSKAQEGGLVIFDFKKFEELFSLCYKSRSLISVSLLFQQFKFSNIKEIENLISFDNFDTSFFSKKSFAVSCIRLGDHDFNSQEVEVIVGDFIGKKLKEHNIEFSVNLSSPDIPVFVYIYENNFFMGVDFAGFDMSKRSYRMFHHTDSVKGSIAYSLIRFSDFNFNSIPKSKRIILDPFGGSGTLAIEAACFVNNKSINFFNKDEFAFHKFPQFDDFDFDNYLEELDKAPIESKKDGNEKTDKKNIVKTDIVCIDFNQRNLKAAEKNAKLAHINKFINFSRTEVEWLDTKFEENSVDIIISNPPKPNKHNDQKEIDKMFKELFYVADFILKKGGKVAIIMKTFEFLKPFAKKYGFEIKKTQSIFQGKEELNFVLFEKV